METKRVSQDNVQFRVETDEVTKFKPSSSATIAIDTDGVVTFGGTGLGSAVADLKDVARGLCFKVGNALHTISSISDADTPVFLVEAPASAVSAANYEVVFPILRWAFTAIVKTPFETSITQDAPLSSRFVVTPTSIIPLPTIQTSLTG